MANSLRRRFISPSTASTVRGTTKTLSWSEIEEWQRDNEYIHSGYRRVQNNWRGCCISVFGYVHNETINIHSHLWGAALFFFFLLTFPAAHVSAHRGTTWKDTAVFAIFLSSAVFCLTASAIYHASVCHSKGVAARCHAFDYAGIVVLIIGSFYPCIYYGFFCDPTYQALYLSMITLAGICASYIVLNPEYAKPTHRGARTKVFIGLGLSAVLPVSHLYATLGFRMLMSEMGFGWLAMSGALYIIGALIYANRIPERLAPGTFDILFASHQIFHFCVVLAALAHYAAVLTAFYHQHSSNNIC